LNERTSSKVLLRKYFVFFGGGRVFEQLIYPGLQRVKRLLPANQRDERWYGRGWRYQQRDKEDFPENLRDH